MSFIGSAILGVGSWLHQVQDSTFVTQYIPMISDALKNIAPITLGMAMVGAIVTTFGIFWQRWTLAIILGVLFALAVFAVAFYGR